jgi:lysozyme
VLKKSSIILNTVLAYLSGGLILYVLFRLFQKKEKTQSSTTNTNIPIFPNPVKSDLTYEELFNWLRLKEGVTYTAKRDGQDKQGNPLFSIGMGHQIQAGEEYLFNRTISEQEVRDLFKKDIEKIVQDVDSLVRVPLNKNQKLALVSIRYNVGPGGFRSGNLLSTLNSGDYQKTSFLIPNFIVTSNGGVYNQSLANRRRTEAVLFSKPV